MTSPRPIFSTPHVFAAAVLCLAFGAPAQTTNGLSEKEIQGRQLAQKLLDQQPAENFTNTGVLQIRAADGKRSEIPVRCEVIVTAANWQSVYTAVTNGNSNGLSFVKLTVTHNGLVPNQYDATLNSGGWVSWTAGETLSSGSNSLRAGMETTIPFAGSDFWPVDLGLEFLHWPDQKVLRGDTARGRLCKILESTNPNPSPNGYSRVDSWIDNETLGIVEARAYDAKGRLLKEFYPKDIKKVDGQWQVGSMEIDNVQTGSRTRLELDLKK